MKHFDFEKDSNGRWYVVLPEWTGEREELEMVLGADSFLEILAQGENKVTVAICTEIFCDFKFKLELVKYENGGGTYNLTSDMFNFSVWLCHVTEFVFGKLPKIIYIA